MNINPIILSIPVFFILIGLELVVDKLRNRSNYRFNDAITNISCGIGEQVTGVFFKLTVVGLYQFLFEHIPGGRRGADLWYYPPYQHMGPVICKPASLETDVPGDKADAQSGR